MTKKAIELSEEQMKKACFKIGKKVFGFMNKQIQNEMEKFPNYKDIDFNSYISLVINLLSNLSINKVNEIETIYKNIFKQEFNGHTLTLALIDALEKTSEIKESLAKDTLN